MRMRNDWLIFAGVAGASAVAAAAWAAHGLSGDPAAQQWADTASRQQLAHAVVVMALSTAPRGLGRAADLC
ncbi:DUF423 domain-containing protein, partial [bacterium]|nr:DUF423 domain-containing protein [bacterium]